jgi:hypothetical protein
MGAVKGRVSRKGDDRMVDGRDQSQENNAGHKIKSHETSQAKLELSEELLD